jgi:hypothetical protein
MFLEIRRSNPRMIPGWPYDVRIRAATEWAGDGFKQLSWQGHRLSAEGLSSCLADSEENGGTLAAKARDTSRARRLHIALARMRC